MLSPDTIGTDLISRGQEVIIHLSCKDWNRNALQSRAWKLCSEGFTTSSPSPATIRSPGTGAAAPVFDIDSVGLLRLHGHERGALSDGRTEASSSSAQLLPRLRRDEPQAPRERGDAAVFKLRKKVETGRAS